MRRHAFDTTRRSEGEQSRQRQRRLSHIPSAAEEESMAEVNSHGSNSSHHRQDEDADELSMQLSSLALTPTRPEKLRQSWKRFKRPAGWLEGMCRTGIVYDAMMLQHGSKDHSERPARLSACLNQLERTGTLYRCFRLESRMASKEEICLAHTARHLSNVQRGLVDDGSDLEWKEGATLASALYSAGCTLQAMESVLNGALDNAFALVRPPGHHADVDQAQGFCFFNNVAISALQALNHPQLCQRVAILDWDVHHGNGTQNIFYDRNDVLYISIHRGGMFYPQTGKASEIGKGEGRGFNVNIPLPGGGFGDADYLLIFECLVMPLIAAFRPDLLLVSAGFDAAKHDPLADMCVSPGCFAQLTQKLQRLEKKIVLVLEGGYNLIQLSLSVDACVKVLLGDRLPSIATDAEIHEGTEKAVLVVADHLQKAWPVLQRQKVKGRIKDFKDRM